MSCAACSARVEKEVGKTAGVSSCSVSLLTNTLLVDGTAEDADIIRAVERAGYGIAENKERGKTSRVTGDDVLADRETPVLLKRFAVSLVFLAALMYFSMGVTMWGFPVPRFFDGNFVSLGILQMLLSLTVMIINKKFFISGARGLLRRSPNMDTLVSLGSAASFGYSVVMLFKMTSASPDAQEGLMHEFYFESAAMILTLITLGKLLEARSKGKTTSALKALMDLSPKKATLLRSGEEISVPIEEVRVGDIFIVRQGESIPVDARIIEGHCAVNEASLTGESIPVDKSAGDSVYSATLNTAGFIKCSATRIGEDTALSQIIKMVSDASATKAPIAKTADKVSGVFVPSVIGIAALTLVIWLIIGQSVGYSLARAVSVLVISCPCALGLATPVAIMVGGGVGARQGILFKNASSLEAAGKTALVALDKTGTVTRGKPCVTDIIPYEADEKELISAAYSVEYASEHPLSRAVAEYAKGLGVSLVPASDFVSETGSGIGATVDGERIFAGKSAYINSVNAIPRALSEKADTLSREGKTPMFFASRERFYGIIAVADTIKDDSARAIAELSGMGIRTYMLTGDNENTAMAVGKAAGVDEVVASVLPGGKADIINRLKKDGKVMMVGDGINDAPALTAADIGIAIGAGTDIAIDAADIVLVKSRLGDVGAAIRLGRATLRCIHQNLFWAFIYNVIGIPLAAGAFVSLGLTLNPMFAAAAMSLSSFFVVTNALRLNLINIRSTKHDRKINMKNKKEKKTMEKTFKVEGMMCPHCEARVKSVLESIDGVNEALVSHKEGSAKVILAKDIDASVFKKAIEDAGYKVL